MTPALFNLQGCFPFPQAAQRNAHWEPRATPKACTSHTSQHLAHFLLSLLGTKAATGHGGSELKQPAQQPRGQESKTVQRDSSAPGAVKELEGSSKVLGGAPTRPSQPQRERRELLEKLARGGRSHLWPLPTHSLTRTVPIHFLGSGLQLLQLWLGSEASESQSRQDSGSC